jgi:predicted amidohydrolase
MQIACAQLDILWEDKPANYAKVERLLDDAALPASALVVLPEMFSTGFSMNVATIAEAPHAETERFLAACARRRNVNLLAGVVTRGPHGMGRNEAVVYDAAGTNVVRYQKLHPFTGGGETRHYAPGDRTVAFDWNGFRVAPFICYDLRFPEVFRAAARSGANLLAVLANWPASRETHWVTLLRARAIENQAYVAAVNRCGNDPSLAYSGRSLIIDPRGEILADAGAAEGVIRADIDPETVAAYRREFPALADARSEFFPDGIK